VSGTTWIERYWLIDAPPSCGEATVSPTAVSVRAGGGVIGVQMPEPMYLTQLLLLAFQA
jgi:hypothetical protein